MNLKYVFLIVPLCLTSFTGKADVIFYDGFESGDMSTTNVDGFTWGGNNRTSIVIQDATDGSVKIWENGSSYEILSDLMPDGTDRDYTTNWGDKSLRFKYYAIDSGVNEPAWTEQRFDFGKGYPDIWVSYHIRVPLNYHRGVPTDFGRNNKWMILLMSNMEGYTDDNITRLGVSDYPSPDDSSIEIASQVRIGNTGGYTPFTQRYPNFVTPADAGKWMQIIYHLKANSAENVNDGLFKMYRKWENEKSFTLISSIDPCPMPISQTSINAGYNGWGGGYFMGWANNMYAEETDWLIDEVTVSDTPLLPNPPKPPTMIKVEICCD